MPRPSDRKRAIGPVNRKMVRRERVHRRLDVALSLPASVVCAGAGSGKTLAVSSWITDRDDVDAAWANVATVGTDPAELWSEIVSAVEDTVAVGAGAPLPSTVLARNAPADVPRRLADWAAGRARPTVIVLDDFDGVTSTEQHEQLLSLVALAPPTLHLVLICRHDPPWPLHRMRLEGELADLRGDVMAFDEDEAMELFALLDLDLVRADVTELVERTKGWAAGLRLAALHMQMSDEPREALLSISGRSEYIADYLVREVYEKLPSHWRRCLTTISIVDQVCPELALALGAPVESVDLLGQLAREHTFVHEIGRRPGWYRLHPLLLDFLRSRAVDEHRRAQSHRLAARWFCEQDEPWTGLVHALVAADFDLAGELIGVHVVSWTVHRPPRDLMRLLEDLPSNTVRSDPGLAIGLAAARVMSGLSNGVEELLDHARSLTTSLAGRRRDRYAFLIKIIGIGCTRWSGDLPRLVTECQQTPTDAATLRGLGLADWPTIRALLINNAASAQMWLGERSEARAHLAKLADRDPGPRLLFPVLNSRAHLAYVDWEEGNLNSAAEAATEVIDQFRCVGLADAVQAACAYLALAGVALDRDDHAASTRWLELAEPTLNEPHVKLASALLRARLLLATGGTGYEAARVIHAAIDSIEDSSVPDLLVEGARRLASNLISGSDVEIAGLEGTVRGRVASEIRRAIADSDVEPLERALDLAAPEGLRRPFTQRPDLHDLVVRRLEAGTAHPEFAAQVLGAMTRPPEPAAGRWHIQPQLTETELNVLHFLATPMSKSEIAEALFVSVNTLKTHQRSIHQKLGATTRREAIHLARENGLL